jgi:tetratricopeptide (TPR) repeat protein
MSTTSAASVRTGEEYFNSGVRMARRAAGFGGLEQLYDRHYAAFAYPADRLKRATIGGLRDRVSWQSSLDALMRAVEIDPEEIEWQRWTALVLEELGRIDDALLVRRTIARINPDSLENNFALGRLLECKGEPVHESGPQVLTGESNYLLALASAAALSGPIVSEHIKQLCLKDRIHGALTVSPTNIALHLAMGFIGIAECDEARTRTSFLTALELAPEPRERCDRWSLALAQTFLRDSSERTTQLGLKDRIRGALTVSPTNVALHLALGFIGIAERDEAATRTSFLTAQVLAEQPGPKEECDPWSLVFAQAFLLGHSDMATSGLIQPNDPIRLALARAALLRSHGAIMPALREYEAAASRLLVQRPPRAYRIYNGYKIVFFKNQFYGVPKDIGDFSILRGCVVNVPDVDEGSGSRGLRSLFAAMLSDRQRARLGYLLRIARPHVQLIAEASRVAIRALGQALRVAIRALGQALRVAIRALGQALRVAIRARQALRVAIRALGQALRVAIRALGQALRVAIRAPWQALRVAIRRLRLAMKTLRRLAGEIYFRRHIVGGVLVDSDAVQLQQRIDALKQAPPDVTASARMSATDRADR